MRACVRACVCDQKADGFELCRRLCVLIDLVFCGAVQEQDHHAGRRALMPDNKVPRGDAAPSVLHLDRVLRALKNDVGAACRLHAAEQLHRAEHAKRKASRPRPHLQLIEA